MANNLITILNRPNWKEELIKYFENEEEGFENVIKKILIDQLGTSSKYFVNLVLYSFTKDELFPAFKIVNGIDEKIFSDRYEQLDKFSFSDKMVKYSVERSICFTEKNQNNYKEWDNYYPRGIKGDNNYSEIRETHRIWIEEIIGKENIEQISFLPLLTGSTQKPVSGVFALNSTCVINDRTLKPLQRIISGIISPIPVQELEYLALQANRKAAIAQVMARNMSHNHGSHVLSRMIHPNQIEDTFQNDEKIRYILSKKIND